MKRVVEIGTLALAALSAVETILGAPAALIVVGAALKIWNLL